MSGEEKLIEWRKRKALSDIKNKNPYIFNSWRAFMYTGKGKKIGHDPSWNDFYQFYNDMHDTYKPGLRLARMDKAQWFCKENCKWITDEENNLLQGDRVRIEYMDKNLTFKEWSAEINVSASAIKNRYYKHPEYSIKEILFGKKAKRNNRKPKDWRDRPEYIRSKASKMISAYKHRDAYHGLAICDIDIDWMIENILNKKCIYCGDDKRIGCDRILNNKGHTKDNVVPCCYECNCARNSNFTHEEMKIIGQTIRKVKEQREQQSNRNMA